jgi:hypothetical protein
VTVNAESELINGVTILETVWRRTESVPGRGGLRQRKENWECDRERQAATDDGATTHRRGINVSPASDFLTAPTAGSNERSG